MSYNQQREGRTQRQGQLNDPSEYGSQAMDPNPVSRAQETSGQEQGWTDKPAYQGGQRGSTGTGTGGTQYGSSTGGTQYGSSTGGTQYGSSTGGTQYGSSTDPTSGSQQYSSGEFSGPTGASADVSASSGDSLTHDSDYSMIISPVCTSTSNKSRVWDRR
ncbi:hypothetical protein AX17_006677 [Amanita inopinata Kibby_2008]|nr:hypothetical protein AX17_006677 [Amanita inopinata Kibby_2008]